MSATLTRLRRTCAAAVFGVWVFVPWTASAAQNSSAGAVSGPVVFGGVTLNGPPPPAPPETSSRNDEGYITIRATRISERPQIDGRLDEHAYETVQPIGKFIQTEPRPGEPATEATEVWILFDDEHIYVAARCWDSAPPDRWVANEMRRDHGNIVRNENFAIMLDTFYDHRKGFVFELTPIGGIWDTSVTNERAPGNTEWNPIWERKAGRFEGGWTVEMAIPFKSLRYKTGREQVWGVNVRRTVRWKNGLPDVLYQ